MREQVEALMFRWRALYPAAAHGDATEQAVRLEEWLATPEIVGCPVELGTAAFDEWKTAHDWPPSVHQFLEVIGTVRARRYREAREAEQMALMAEYDESIVPPEEAVDNITQLRETIEAMQAKCRAALEPSDG